MAEEATGLTSVISEQHTPSSKVENYIIISPRWPYQEWQTVKTGEVNEHPNEAAHRVLDRPERICDVGRKGCADSDLSDTAEEKYSSEVRRGQNKLKTRQHNLTPKDVASENIDLETDMVTLYKREQCEQEIIDSAQSEYNATQNIVARRTHLQTFLKQLENDLKVNLDTSDKNPVMSEINTMMKNVVKQLRDTNELFKDCRLLKAGSVAEKTKIGKLNEFDFLLVIERFRNRQEFSMFLNINWLMILARDVPENKRLLEMYPSLFETNKDGDKVYLTNVRDTLTGLFLDLLRNSLLGDWTMVTTDEKRICTSDIATTLHLVSRKHDIDVDVDVCLCFPVSVEDISHATAYLKDDRSITYFEYIKCLTEGMKEIEIDVLAIAGSKESFFTFPTTSTRITVPLLE